MINENEGGKYAFLEDFIPIGRDNAVSGKSLDEAWKCRTRDRYELIMAARKSGMIICSCMNGYYRPENASEIKQYYEVSRKKAITVFETLMAARNELKRSGIPVK